MCVCVCTLVLDSHVSQSLITALRSPSFVMLRVMPRSFTCRETLEVFIRSALVFTLLFSRLSSWFQTFLLAFVDFGVFPGISQVLFTHEPPGKCPGLVWISVRGVRSHRPELLLLCERGSEEEQRRGNANEDKVEG